MEIYVKNTEGQLQETNLMSILSTALRNAGFNLDNGRFNGENHQWVGIVQETESPSPMQITTNLTFEDDGNTITGVNVYETPIRRVVDSDLTKKLI